MTKALSTQLALLSAACITTASLTGACSRREDAGPATSPRDIAAAKATIADYVEKHATETPTHETVVSFAGEPLDLTPPVTIDIESGSGHGNAFDFVRLSVSGDGAEIERFVWRGRTMSRDAASATVERASRPADAAWPVIDLVRALSITSAERRRKPDAPLGGGSTSSSRDFFVLIRALDASGDILLQEEYAGYAGSGNEASYLPLEAIRVAARRHLDDIEFTAVAPDAIRTSHFSNAFSLNVEPMLRDGHWWVMEHGLEALAFAGNRSALDALEELSERSPSLPPRQRAKLARLLSDPATYLEGPPRDLRGQ